MDFGRAVLVHRRGSSTRSPSRFNPRLVPASNSFDPWAPPAPVHTAGSVLPAFRACPRGISRWALIPGTMNAAVTRGETPPRKGLRPPRLRTFRGGGRQAGRLGARGDRGHVRQHGFSDIQWNQGGPGRSILRLRQGGPQGQSAK
jgi:hypothetical protein